MAIVSYIKEKKQTVSAMKGVIDYCAQRQKVYDTDSDRELISGIHCQGQNAFMEFMATKQAYKKIIQNVNMRAETPFHLHKEIRHNFQQNIRQNMVAHLSDLVDGFLRTSPFVYEQIQCSAVAFRVPVLIVSDVLCFDISTVFCGVEQFSASSKVSASSLWTCFSTKVR